MSARVCKKYQECMKNSPASLLGGMSIITSFVKDAVCMLGYATGEDFAMMRETVANLSALSRASGNPPSCDKFYAGILNVIEEYEEQAKAAATVNAFDVAWNIDTECLVLANGGMSLTEIRKEFTAEDAATCCTNGSLN